MSNWTINKVTLNLELNWVRHLRIKHSLLIKLVFVAVSTVSYCDNLSGAHICKYARAYRQKSEDNRQVYSLLSYSVFRLRNMRKCSSQISVWVPYVEWETVVKNNVIYSHANCIHKAIGKLLGRVVQKPFNVNLGLNVNWSITFSYLKMFFTCNVWCSLRLLHAAQNWRAKNINRTPRQKVLKLKSKFSLTLD